MTDELSISPMEVDRQAWADLLAVNAALREKLEKAEGAAMSNAAGQYPIEHGPTFDEAIGQLEAVNAALREKLEKAERERDALDRALQSLTVGGSEYVNDPERCVAAVRERFRIEHDATLKFKRERDEAQAACAEWVRAVPIALLADQPGYDGSVMLSYAQWKRLAQLAKQANPGAAMLARLEKAEGFCRELASIYMQPSTPCGGTLLRQFMLFAKRVAAAYPAEGSER